MKEDARPENRRRLPFLNLWPEAAPRYRETCTSCATWVEIWLVGARGTPAVLLLPDGCKNENIRLTEGWLLKCGRSTCWALVHA